MWGGALISETRKSSPPRLCNLASCMCTCWRYELESKLLKWGSIRDCIGENYGSDYGDTRSLDYSSYGTSLGRSLNPEPYTLNLRWLQKFPFAAPLPTYQWIFRVWGLGLRVAGHTSRKTVGLKQFTSHGKPE